MLVGVSPTNELQNVSLSSQVGRLLSVQQVSVHAANVDSRNIILLDTCHVALCAVDTDRYK